MMAHAIESYMSKRRNPFSSALASEAVYLGFEYLSAVAFNLQNVEARSLLLLAAHYAGIAFFATGLGAAHALAHSITSVLGVTHGVALGILLPQVIETNKAAVSEELSRLTGLIAKRISNDDLKSALIKQGLPYAICTLAEQIGLPTRIKQIVPNVSEAQLRQISALAASDDVIANNPIDLSEDQLYEILVAMV